MSPEDDSVPKRDAAQASGEDHAVVVRDPFGELAQTVLNEVSVGIMTCDDAGRPTLVNRAMRRLFGLEDTLPQAAMWWAGCDLYLPDGVTRMALEDIPWRRASGGERVRAVEMIVAPLSGASRIVSVDVQPLESGGSPIGLVIVAQDITDRRWAEAELTATARRYSSIVESVKEVIFHIDASGAWSFLNPAWSDFTGADTAASLGRPWLDSLHPDDRQRAAKMISALAASGDGACRAELRLLTDGGSFRWIELFGRHTDDAEGTVAGTSGTFHDITDRKRADEALHLSDQILRQLPEAVIVTNLDGRIERWMGKAAQHFGYEVEEALGRPLSFLCRADFAERLTTSTFGAPRGAPHVEEVVCLRKDGSEVPVEVTSEPLYDKERRPLFFVAIARDISERKRAEAERAHLIREQAARVEAERAASRWALMAEATTALTASLEYAVALDGMGRLLVSSFADWCLIDLVEEDSCTRRMVTLARSPAETTLLVDSLARRGLPPGLERALSDPFQARVAASMSQVADPWPESSSEEPWSEADAAALIPRSTIVAPMMSRGEPIGVLTLVRGGRSRPFDDEELALVQEMTRRASLAIDNARLYHRAQRAVDLRDEFLSIASHELRTPLQTLSMVTESLRLRVEKQPDGLIQTSAITKAVLSARRQTQRLAQLTGELLDVSRIYGGQLEVQREQVDLHKMIHEVVERFTDELTRARCAIDLSGVQSVKGHWDAIRLDQVITNLLTNAIKYGAGAPIDMGTEEGEGLARIFVKDKGIGIAKEDQERIFQRFERAAPGRQFSGLGLGLYITHQIVEAHGGSLHVQSETGKGSTFIVELPLSFVGAV